METAQQTSRSKPNILITGTPGTGKTSMCQMIAEATNFRHINVGDVVKEKECHNGLDEEFDSFILDEDKICDELEELVAPGGVIVDFHSCDFFPERWFDLVIVLRADNTILFDRLKKRGYSSKKITENIECEIMQVVLQEAQDSYAEDIVHELESNSTEDMEANIQRIQTWISHWMSNNS